jgi:hypothetical protein
MKMIVFALLGLFMLLSLSFAADISACDALEETCMRSCCTNAGGTVGDVTVDTVKCEGTQEVVDAADSCIYSQCRPQIIECAAPGSGCSQKYSSCVSKCSTTACYDQCDTTAFQCVDSSLAQPGIPSGCCGPAAILLLVGGFAVFRK